MLILNGRDIIYRGTGGIVGNPDNIVVYCLSFLFARRMISQANCRGEAVCFTIAIITLGPY